MVRDSRPIRVVSSLLALAAAVGLSLVSIAPAQAATNATLGDLNAANPSANIYAGCVASVLTGSGVTFGSAAAMGSNLASLWPSLPAGVANACKQAVDTKQPQVCVSPIDPATCPAIGSATAAAFADQAVAFIGDWKIGRDSLGTLGYAQTPLATSGASAPMATVSGTFTTPTSVCTSKDCTVPPAPGLWTDCGATTCGPVTKMTVSVIGRTPNGENGTVATVHLVDGFGHYSDTFGMFGQSYWNTGCGAAECVFSPRIQWDCRDAHGATGANCGGQTLAVTFTFNSGVYPGGCMCAAPAPSIGQVSEIQLAADNLSYSGNPSVCAGLLDCARFDDSRLSYLDGSSKPTVVEYPGATAPSAVIDLASSSLGCLIGVNVTRSSAISCLDVNGASAPLLQTAHAPVVPAPPPTVTAVANPSGGWQRTPVTVTLTANGGTGPGVQSITYTTVGGAFKPETVVLGATAQVVVSADGVTTLNFWATDKAGASGPAQSLIVRVDSTPPAITCAAPSTSWSASDVTVACAASDPLSGLANPSQAQLSLTTAVPAGTETAAASTGSANVCDLAGNCAAAGPITGLKVDRLGPSITITAPAGSYTQGQAVKADYACTDGGSGVATCTGPVPSGTAFNTATEGIHSFTVDATDAVGNHSQLVASYVVTVPPPPTVMGSASPSGGWQRTPVTVSLSASADKTRTVQSISYSATGAQATTGTAVVPGASTQVVVTADGTTTLTFWATDSGGTPSATQTLAVQVDRTAPAIVCAAPSASWSSSDQTIVCTAGDGLSGLANPAPAQLNLTTAVPAGTETAAAATNSVSVCDTAGNCATAGPITGLKVDRAGPSITVTAPTGTYTVGQAVKAAYTCADGGSGVATCSGTVPSGNAVDTATAGTHSFTIDAIDVVGNHTQRVLSYTVTAAAPSPTCKEDENLNKDQQCEKKHDVAVRPVTSRPTPAPAPQPATTHKPTPRPSVRATEDTGNHSTD